MEYGDPAELTSGKGKGGFLSKFKSSSNEDVAQEAEENAPLLPFKDLFRFTTLTEKIYIVIAVIAACIHGGTLPVWTIIFGRVIRSFGDVEASGDISNVVNVIGGVAKWFLIIAAITFFVAAVQVRFLMIVSSRTSIRIRKMYFRSLMSQDKAWYDSQNTGELTARVATDVNVIQAGIGDKIGSAAQFLAQGVVGFIIAFVYSWKLTLVILSITPFLAISGAIFAKFTADSTSDGQGAYGAAGAIANEVVSLIRTVHAFGGQKEEARRYEQKLNDAYKSGVVKGFINGAGMGVTMFLIFCSYALSFWYGAKLVRNGEIGAQAVFVAFFSVLMAAMGLGQAAPSFSSFSAARGAAPRVFEIIDRVSAIDSFSNEGSIPAMCGGDISFNDVTFNYASREADGGAPVVRDLNLHIKSGTTHALVGASGCGKSSTMSLIERFYDVNAGSVTIDGADVRELNVRWLRSQMGYVGQMPTLFRGSIWDNIAYGAALQFGSDFDGGWKREEVSNDEIVSAAKLANAHQFIMRLPEQYDTKLGDRGALLSGGQKQRICIARAIVRNPKILLLDEATSALDARSEHIVQEALERASEGRTTVVIAHRLSTVRNADTISTFKDGAIVESGRYDELIAQNGVFKELVELQQVKAEKGDEDDKDVDPEALPAVGRTQSISKTVGMSLDKSIVEVDDEGNELPETDPNVVARTFKFNSAEWLYILLGCFGAVLAGASWPVSAYVFAQVTALLRPNADGGKVVFWSGMFLVIGAGSLIGNLFQFGFLGVSAQKLTRKLRVNSFRALLRQEIGYFDREENSVGAVTARLATDAAAVESLCGGTLGMIAVTLASVGAGIIVSFQGCWELALVVLVCLPFMGFAGYIQMRTMTGFDAESKKDFVASGGIASEAVDNINTVSPLGIQDHFVSKYNDSLVTPQKNGDKGASVSGIAFGFSEFFMYGLWAIGFWFGAKTVELKRCNFVGVLEGLTGILFAGITLGNVSVFAPDIASARVSATHIFRLLDREPEIKTDSDIPSANISSGVVALMDAKFEYPTRPDVPVLRGMFLEAVAGKTIALVGASGCGKSTVVALIQRFYDLRSGSLTVDGQELREMNVKQSREHMSFVQQEPDLFNRTIRENIAYGLSKEEGTPVVDSEIEASAKLANAHDFIMKLPKQYDTEVGERGGHLSGGMKQRIAIARALVRKPKVLLLDEASSALDAVSERVVQDALDEARQGRTTFVIAHRLSTIKEADKIAMVQKGKVVEVGTHDELLAKGGAYAQLIKHQMTDGNGY